MSLRRAFIINPNISSDDLLMDRFKLENYKILINAEDYDVIVDGMSFNSLKKELGIGKRCPDINHEKNTAIGHIRYGYLLSECEKTKEALKEFNLNIGDDYFELNSNGLDIIIDGLNFRKLLERKQLIEDRKNIKKLEEKIEELKYMPGMAGYHEALNSFNSLK